MQYFFDKLTITIITECNYGYGKCNRNIMNEKLHYY